MRPFRLLVAVLVALAVSTPAAAQFGKIKNALNKKTESKPETSPAGAPADGGVVVVTPDVVDRLLGADKAAKAEREKAVQEDTPYGRHIRAKAAYEAAQTKCHAAQATWATRAAADEKLINRYTALADKAMAAQEKGDMAAYEAGMYEALAVVDPSCAVKEPKQPDDFYDAQRATEERVNQAKLRSTGLTDREYGLTSDRIIAILNETDVPGGASPRKRAPSAPRSGSSRRCTGSATLRRSGSRSRRQRRIRHPRRYRHRRPPPSRRSTSAWSITSRNMRRGSKSSATAAQPRNRPATPR